MVADPAQYPPAPIPPRELRTVLGSFATGVTVVTTYTPAGYAGLTVNSFTSVSLEPPLVLLCVRRRSTTGEAIECSGSFAINVLGREQEHLARHFCSGSGDRFAGLDVRRRATGAPILGGVLAYLDCELEQALDAGDHRIVIGRVLAAERIRSDAPLLFYQGCYQ